MFSRTIAAFTVLVLALAGCSDTTSGANNDANNRANKNNGNNGKNANNANSANNTNTGNNANNRDCSVGDDTDGDGLKDVCDNCPMDINADQSDTNGDGIGDACQTRPSNNVCGQISQEFEELKPNIYVVVDRSTSMKQFDGVATSRMERAKEGLDQIADQLGDDIRFGLSTYPCARQNDACNTLNKELLAMGDYTKQEIKDSYGVGYTDATCPHGNVLGLPGLDIEEGGKHCTETGSAMLDVLNKKLYETPGDRQNDVRAKAVVLVTDGGACGCSAQEPAVDAAGRLAALGVPVYVIGFNISSQRSLNMLDKIAEAGGTDAGAMGSPRYFEATNAQELLDVIKAVKQQSVTCSFELSMEPEDARRIWVSVDGQWLDEDPSNGFSYDAATNTVTVNGAACDELKDIQPNDEGLKIELGCAGCYPTGAGCQDDSDCCVGICGQGQCLVL